MFDAVIVDYGLGNLHSVKRAVEASGFSANVTSDLAEIQNANRLIFPGVGAFGTGMGTIKAKGIDDVLRRFSATERPVLGICLGMQLMLGSSDEFGQHKGLGFFSGQVVKIPQKKEVEGVRKVPVVGWKSVENTECNVFNKINFVAINGARSWYYFTHSFMATLDDDSQVVAQYDHIGQKVSAIIARENLLGVQFHPEKSGRDGLSVFRAFFNL
jgi:imidazole glycerol-phosphate synthase subunit HisH